MKRHRTPNPLRDGDKGYSGVSGWNRSDNPPISKAVVFKDGFLMISRAALGLNMT